MANASNSLIVVVLLYLFLAFSSVIGDISPEWVRFGRSQREFDYFLLALQWPGTYCSRTRHCCPSNGCCRSNPLTEFTIHGLWPDYNDGSWPACCSSSEFKLEKVSSLIPMLEKYWPTLSCSSSSLCHGGKGLFWAHEWEKHGTCSYPVIQDEYSYFSKALDLYSKYNITRVLNNAGILATNAERYSLEHVIATIEAAVGASPTLVCKHGSLEELRLCFDKVFKPRDCMKGSGQMLQVTSSSCPKYISLPSYSPLVIEDRNETLTRLADGETFSLLSWA